MSNLVRTSMKKGVMLGISNKTMPITVDRLTLYISQGDFEKAKAELKELKIQVSEVERLMKEIEMIANS